MHMDDSAENDEGRHTFGFGGGVRIRFLQDIEDTIFAEHIPSRALTISRTTARFYFTRNFGVPSVSLGQHDVYGFVQDQMRLPGGFSLYAGLRYEWESVLNDSKSFAPRLSVAKQLGSRTVLRGGAGIFYDRPPVLMAEDAVLFDGAHIRQIVMSNPSYPVILDQAGADLATPSIMRMASNLRHPSIFQGSVGIDQKLGEGRNYLTIEYVTTRGTHMFRTRNVNAPLPARICRWIRIS